jgi:hypothetical protein
MVVHATQTVQAFQASQALQSISDDSVPFRQLKLNSGVLSTVHDVLNVRLDTINYQTNFYLWMLNMCILRFQNVFILGERSTHGFRKQQVSHFDVV